MDIISRICCKTWHCCTIGGVGHVAVDHINILVLTLIISVPVSLLALPV